MKIGEEKIFHLYFSVVFSGEFYSNPSTAYEYYNNDFKAWTEPFLMKIHEKPSEAQDNLLLMAPETKMREAEPEEEAKLPIGGDLMQFFEPAKEFNEMNVEGITEPQVVGQSKEESMAYDLLELKQSFKALLKNEEESKREIALLKSELDLCNFHHENFGCDGCNVKYFKGNRYHCKDCADFDFCEQ